MVTRQIEVTDYGQMTATLPDDVTVERSNKLHHVKVSFDKQAPAKQRALIFTRKDLSEEDYLQIGVVPVDIRNAEGVAERWSMGSGCDSNQPPEHKVYLGR